MTKWWSDRSRCDHDDRRARRMASRRLGVALLRDRVFGGLWRFAEACVLALEGRASRFNPSKIHIPDGAVIRFGDLMLKKKTPDA